MNDPFADFEVISVYTNDQAVDDGIKIKLHDGIFATTNAMHTIVPEAFDEDGTLDQRAVIAAFLDVFTAYDAGVYHDATAKYPEEADRYHATYSVRGHEVWLILDGEGMHIILPEDY